MLSIEDRIIRNCHQILTTRHFFGWLLETSLCDSWRTSSKNWHCNSHSQTPSWHSWTTRTFPHLCWKRQSSSFSCQPQSIGFLFSFGIKINFIMSTSNYMDISTPQSSQFWDSEDTSPESPSILHNRQTFYNNVELIKTKIQQKAPLYISSDQYGSSKILQVKIQSLDDVLRIISYSVVNEFG